MTKKLFEATDEEFDLVFKIVERVVKRCDHITPITLELDLLCTHTHIPLNLQAMLDADDYNLFHDIVGIQSHINRATGKLEGCFYPRFALEQ